MADVPENAPERKRFNLLFLTFVSSVIQLSCCLPFMDFLLTVSVWWRKKEAVVSRSLTVGIISLEGAVFGNDISSDFPSLIDPTGMFQMQWINNITLNSDS